MQQQPFDTDIRSEQHVDYTVQNIVDVLETAYPPALAESWDKVGLICGDPTQSVTKVAVALDCTQAVAEAAVAAGAQMLIVHHPLLLRGVHTVAANTPKGKIIHTLIQAGVALFAAHTNADSARPGVNDKLAQLVGISSGRPLAPQLDMLEKWGVQVPQDAVSAVQKAVFAVGAGEIGEYSECSFAIAGQGQFRAKQTANPALGAVGELTQVAETRLEFVAPQSKHASIISALEQAHPYEEVAFDVFSMDIPVNPEHAVGLGRIGTLPEPMSFVDFVEQIAQQLPSTVWGVRGAGDPQAQISTVAVSSGAGDSFLDAAVAAGVDAFVTSDLRHHPVDETRAKSTMCIVDTAHWASEYPWTSQVQEILEEQTTLAVDIIPIRTDPWTVVARGKEEA